MAIQTCDTHSTEFGDDAPRYRIDTSLPHCILQSSCRHRQPGRHPSKLLDPIERLKDADKWAN